MPQATAMQRQSLLLEDFRFPIYIQLLSVPRPCHLPHHGIFFNAKTSNVVLSIRTVKCRRFTQRHLLLS